MNNLFHSTGGTQTAFPSAFQQQQQASPFGPQPGGMNPFGGSTNPSGGMQGGGFGNNTLSGGNNLFNPPNNNNNNLFSSNTGGGMNTPNTMWNQPSSSGNSSLFNRNTPMPANLFSGTSGGNNNTFATNTTGNPFQGTNTMMAPSGNTGMNSFNNPLNSNSSMSNNLFNSTIRHNYNTRGNLSVGSSIGMTDRKGTVSMKYAPKKNTDGLVIHSVTYMSEYKEKSFDELRMEDYAIIKAGEVPDSLKKQIQANMEGSNGNMGSGMMLGSSSNDLFNQQGIRQTPTLSMGGSSMGSSLTTGGAFANNTIGRTASPWPSTNTGTGAGTGANNLFNSQNSFTNNNALPNFGGQQNSAFPSTNAFAQSSNNNQGLNLFAAQQNQNQNVGFFNQPQQNNMVGGFPRIQSQGNLFPQTSTNAQTGANMFQNTQSMPQGNAFLQNKNPSLFPNSNTTSNAFITKINPTPGFPSQVFPQSAPNFFNNPTNPQLQTNPHLFPPFPGNTAAPFASANPFPQPFNHFGQQNFTGFPNPGQPNQQLFPNSAPYQPSFPGFNLQQNPNDPFNNTMNPFGQNNAMNFNNMQTTYYIPYQEDRSQSSYMSRNTLSDIVNTLDSKLSNEPKNSPQRPLSKFPYNPFERKINRRADIENRDPIRNSSLLWHPPSQSISRKPDDAFTLIKKSRYIEDDVEIIMRPKVTIQQSARNRSYSPTSNRSRDTIIEDHKRGTGRSIYNNTVKLRVYTVSSAGRKEVDVSIFRKALVVDLKRKVLEAMRTNSLLRLEMASLEELVEKSMLSYNERTLTDDRTLDQIGLNDGSHLTLHIDDEPMNEQIILRDKRKPSEEIQTETYAVVRRDESYSGSRHLPKLTKAGYFTLPSLDELSRMSDRELATVEGFTMGNEHGKIEFEGRTDVRDLDLDELVVIYQKNAEVYPDEKFPTDSSKPIRGEKLNKPAMITLYNCAFSSKYKGSALKRKLEEHTRKLDCEFIDYDETNAVYRLRATHF